MPLALTIGGLFFVGCQGRPTTDFSVLNLAKVTGVVTLDGEPLAGAYVVFEEAETKSRRTCYAFTDESGFYTLIRGSRANGCLPGRMVVRITLRRTNEEDEDAAPAKDVKIPTKYNRKSKVFVDVEPNGTHTFDFDLTSK